MTRNTTTIAWRGGEWVSCYYFKGWSECRRGVVEVNQMAKLRHYTPFPTSINFQTQQSAFLPARAH